MIQKSIERLKYLVEIVPGRLEDISEESFSEKPAPEKWSKKQILGHLIDSAANNHQRFVRGQFEEQPEIAYDQNRWNEFSFYQAMDSRLLIQFWTAYNRHLPNSSC